MTAHYTKQKGMNKMIDTQTLFSLAGRTAVITGGASGLGLAITRNAIVMHRGAIKVKSEEHKGTTFSVRIPLTYIA